MAMSKHQKVLNSIEDQFFETGKLPGISEIVDRTGMSKHQVRPVIKELLGRGIEEIYGGKGKPSVYIRRGMKNSIYAKAGEPAWIGEHEFGAKKVIQSDLEEQREKLTKYQTIERLLYGTGEPLEDSVGLAFEILEYDYGSTEDEEDFFIKNDEQIYVVEVKGKSGQLNKGDATQLNGWLDKWIDEENIDSDKLNGLVIINAERSTPPEERGEPLTKKAHEYLKLRSSDFRTTKELFGIIKQIKNDQKSIRAARTEFLEA